ncbi:MAG: DUF456 domain-containing protein [Planctomycetales bacterium]|nr:DUF456 domain-containing protein [Planctomycetales bacterium]
MDIFGWHFDFAWTYYVWALLLFVLNVVAWTSNIFTLPGNWIIVALTAAFAWLFPSVDGSTNVSWWCVLGLIILAGIGELIEFFASAAGAVKHGASRRAIVLSLIGSIVGSFAGVVIGAPVPVIGSAVGAIVFGAVGAFAGGYWGEQWRGNQHDQRIAVAQGALTGRLFGTFGKLFVGALMVGLATVDSLI